MQIPDEIQCRACQYLSSHPVDACPVCGAQFYWLLLSTYPLSESQVQDFIVQMEHLVKGTISREFLTHGGQLWLPHAFWNYNPNGDVLKEFPWIAELKFFQHDPSTEERRESQEEGTDEKPSMWDTNPMVDLKKLAEKSTLRTAIRPKRDQKKPRAASQPRKTLIARDVSSSRLLPPELFAPLMVLVFLLFLSLSYMALRYHKNQRPAAGSEPNTEVVTDENTVLP